MTFCKHCPGHCCSMPVDITSFDILRICAELSLQPGDFVDVVPADQTDYYAFKAYGTNVKFQLRSRGYCSFYRNGASLKCSIHPQRPMMCRLYPHIPKDAGCSVQDSAVCPKSNLSQAKKTDCDSFGDFEWESKRYVGLVAEWNALSIGDMTPDRFFDYCIKEIRAEGTPWGHVKRSLQRGFLRMLGKMRGSGGLRPARP